MQIQQPGPHLDHMLRQTRSHHVQLSSMADMKANMLLTVSSVIITLTAPHVVDSELRRPLLVWIGFSLLTIGLAAYAVMPKFPLWSGRPARLDMKDSRFNLLFFGDFVRLRYEDFEAAMEEVMNDPSHTYQAQVREIYTLGVFLAERKYRFLRLAYLSFLAGLVVSCVAAFALLK